MRYTGCMTDPAPPRPAPTELSPLAIPAFPPLLLAFMAGGFAARGLAVVIGFQIYALTKDPLALGLLGLVEAIPALSLALFGGYIADQFNRRSIVLVTRAALALCGLALTLLSVAGEATSVWALYAVIFVFGIARGFSEPAFAGLEAQLVPRERAVRASAWLASAGQTAAVLGPAGAGFAYAHFGVASTYAVFAVLYAVSFVCVLTVPHPPSPRLAGVTAREPVWHSIGEGLRFVFANPIFLGAMSLDLFAVLFGGAIALLPIFATDLLQVGPEEFGLLSAAPAVGALTVMLVSIWHPPVGNAGRNLLLAVGGFGVAIIVFGISESFYLSLLALAVSGACDGVSMVIRRTIMRMLSPDHLRGRIASVSSVFIGASNELGALESGVAAKFLGARPTVWLGGIVTLIVVALVAWRAPALRRLRLR